MKPNILVLYYSQSGQLKEILANLIKDFGTEVNIDFKIIEPVVPFPWPWNAYAFFDAMPETVQRIPIPIKPVSVAKDYDLVILGYQPWFLNPSLPTTSFLNSEYANILKGKPVITVIGCRNMWLNGQEQVKGYLQNIGAHLVGNIVLKDSNPNLISTLTIIRWSFKGQKEASGWLPAAGVQDEDIKNVSRYGLPIIKHLQEKTLDSLQTDLEKMGAVNLKPGLVLLEQRGIKNFRYWSKYIREKGGPGDLNRKGRIILFKRLLLVGIFVLSPISSFSAYIKLQLNKKKLLKDVAYYKSISFEKGRI